MSAIEPRFGIILGSGCTGQYDGIHDEATLALRRPDCIGQSKFVGDPVGLHVFVVVRNTVGAVFGDFFARIE